MQARYNKTTIRVHRLPLLPGEETCRTVWEKRGLAGLELVSIQAVKYRLPEREGLWGRCLTQTPVLPLLQSYGPPTWSEQGLTWHNLSTDFPKAPAILSRYFKTGVKRCHHLQNFLATGSDDLI